MFEYFFVTVLVLILLALVLYYQNSELFTYYQQKMKTYLKQFIFDDKIEESFVNNELNKWISNETPLFKEKQ